jgi:hypothetical protein
VPEWSASEWASIAAAFWAAVAATASWVTILLDRRRQREAMQPHVKAGFNVLPTRVARLVFANGGPGLAIGIGYMGVHKDDEREYKYGGFVGNGFLQAGGEHAIAIGQVTKAKGEAQFVWFCNDVHNTVHVWAYDGRYQRIAAKDYLSGNAPRKFGDYFALMYPGVAIPPHTYGRELTTGD